MSSDSHDISYLNTILSSWAPDVTTAMQYSMPTIDEVMSATLSSVQHDVVFNHDGFDWLSSWLINVQQYKHKVNRCLIINLPNDRKLDVSEELLSVLKPVNCDLLHHDGWTYLNKAAWSKLQASEDFAREWFGVSAESGDFKRILLYHNDENYVDMSFACPSMNVRLQFSFEPDLPLRPILDSYWC